MANDEAQRPLDMSALRVLNLGVPTTDKDATYTDNTTGPANPAAAASAGASLLAAAQNHVHQGVHSVHSDAAANIYGDVRLVSGTGISLTQSGQDITVATTGAAVNKISWAEEKQVSETGTTPGIIAEYNMNFDDCATGNIQARLSAIVKASGGTATFKLYTGATSPGATTGGTVRATLTSTSTTFEKQTNLGSAFTNPTGQVLVQITAEGSAGGIKATIRGLEGSIG